MKIQESQKFCSIKELRGINQKIFFHMYDKQNANLLVYLKNAAHVKVVFVNFLNDIKMCFGFKASW